MKESLVGGCSETPLRVRWRQFSESRDLIRRRCVDEDDLSRNEHVGTGRKSHRNCDFE